MATFLSSAPAWSQQCSREGGVGWGEPSRFRRVSTWHHCYPLGGSLCVPGSVEKRVKQACCERFSDLGIEPCPRGCQAVLPEGLRRKLNHPFETPPEMALILLSAQRERGSEHLPYTQHGRYLSHLRCTFRVENSGFPL